MASKAEFLETLNVERFRVDPEVNAKRRADLEANMHAWQNDRRITEFQERLARQAETGSTP